jgi:hypothetical protein
MAAAAAPAVPGGVSASTLKRWDADPLSAFAVGVRAALDLWEALNTAIENGWGDSCEYEPEEQREQLTEMLVELFTMSTGV